MPTPYWQDPHVTIWHGDALDLPIPDESVDLICTSPPYWSLRSYLDQGQHYDGQIGSEATPGEFIDALAAATREMARVLKPSGSIFVNLGDKYGPDKSLMLLPERYRIRCTDDLGLIARAVILWSKVNGMPESVTDRVRRSHEDWVHLTKEPRYFSAVDEIREPHTWGREINPAWAEARQKLEDDRTPQPRGNGFGSMNPLGKLPGSVWTIPTQPLTVPAHLGVDHFAAFPLELPRRIIRGWSPSGICVECGEGRRPMADRAATGDARMGHGMGSRHTEKAAAMDVGNRGVKARSEWHTGVSYLVTGYACACPAPTAPTRPAVVLDPFGGTGTTALVAKALGRIGWHVDLSADYCRLAQWRVTDPGELARAMQVEKPPPAPEDMDSLLDLLEGGAA